MREGKKEGEGRTEWTREGWGEGDKRPGREGAKDGGGRGGEIADCEGEEDRRRQVGDGGEEWPRRDT